NMQPDKRDGNKCGKNSERYAQHWGFFPSPGDRRNEQAEKNYVQQIAGKNVGPETDGQGENTRRGTDEFNGKKKNAEQPVAQRLGRTRERQHVVADRMMLDPLPVEI